MKINPIFAVIACIMGLVGVFVAYSSALFSNDLLIGASITVISVILGLTGIFLFEKDFKLAIVQYIICAFGALLGVGQYAIISFLLFIIAAVISFFEKRKSTNYTERRVLDAHFFGDESEIRERYNNFPKNSTNSTIYWIIPIVTVILLLLAAVMGSLLTEDNMDDKMDSIEIDNLTCDIKKSYVNYTGGVHGLLSSQRDFSNVQIKGKWYSSNGTLIDETIDSNVTNLASNHNYQINLPYNKPTTIKPAKAEIEVYEPGTNIILYSKNITFN